MYIVNSAGSTWYFHKTFHQVHQIILQIQRNLIEKCLNGIYVNICIIHCDIVSVLNNSLLSPSKDATIYRIWNFLVLAYVFPSPHTSKQKKAAHVMRVRKKKSERKGNRKKVRAGTWLADIPEGMDIFRLHTLDNRDEEYLTYSKT